MVIVEYCQFGSLHSILVNHQKVFIDQIVTNEDRIDPKIMTRDSVQYVDFNYPNEPQSDSGQSVVNSLYIQCPDDELEPDQRSVVNSLYVPGPTTVEESNIEGKKLFFLN